jgi:hypothetical protein
MSATRGLTVALGLAGAALAAPTALACNVCYGSAEGHLIDAARMGIWLLLGVTVAMQGAFAAFFLYLRRRARQAGDGAGQTEGVEG